LQPLTMAQTWRHLLFLHYPVAPSLLADRLPEGLEPELFDGQAWLSIVPFQLAYRLPGLPLTVPFNELNLRTYVRPQAGYTDNAAGVYFFCLDANDGFSVEAARALYGLNYLNATSRMTGSSQRGWQFTSVRTDRRGAEAAFQVTYTPRDEALKPTALDTWLVERYRLYTADGHGGLQTARIQHPPWPLYQVDVTLHHNTLFEAHGFLPPLAPPRVAYADVMPVKAHLPEPVFRRVTLP
jgi:uncharacterized protein